MRSLEERLKFDHGLKIGQSLIELTHIGQSRRALVDISARGKVRVLLQPRAEDMYSSWRRVYRDDTTKTDGSIIVWGARNPEILEWFKGEPVATVSLKETAK